MTAPLQVFEVRCPVKSEDIQGGHVAFSRYFLYIGDAFASWYSAMGVSGSGRVRETRPLMAHTELDFLGEMSYPGALLCRLTVVRLGRSSLEHRIELFDADQPERLVGRGRAINVWQDQRVQSSTAPWPADVVAKCWSV